MRLWSGSCEVGTLELGELEVYEGAFGKACELHHCEDGKDHASCSKPLQIFLDGNMPFTHEINVQRPRWTPLCMKKREVEGGLALHTCVHLDALPMT